MSRRGQRLVVMVRTLDTNVSFPSYCVCMYTQILMFFIQSGTYYFGLIIKILLEQLSPNCFGHTLQMFMYLYQLYTCPVVLMCNLQRTQKQNLRKDVEKKVRNRSSSIFFFSYSPVVPFVLYSELHPHHSLGGLSGGRNSGEEGKTKLTFMGVEMP